MLQPEGENVEYIYDDSKREHQDRLRKIRHRMRNAPRIFGIFKAIVLFRRFIFRKTKDIRQRREFLCRYKRFSSPLHREIYLSNHAVKSVSQGHSLSLSPKYITETDEASAFSPGAEMKSSINEKKYLIGLPNDDDDISESSFYFSPSTRPKTSIYNVVKTIQLLRPKQPILKDDLSSTNESSFHNSTSDSPHKARVHKDSIPIDLSAVDAKNSRAAISSKDLLLQAVSASEALGGTTSTNKQKNLRKLDLQEVLDYIPGTAIYFGATVAIQATHGGYLQYSDGEGIVARADSILPSARFTIRNCDDLSDQGVTRYGDAVWLQAGANEVLGAQYGGEPVKQDELRVIHPALINCRRGNLFKAQQYGRWIVLKANSPTKCLGEQVLHHDTVVLEQEWYFLASNNPAESFMQKQHFRAADSHSSKDRERDRDMESLYSTSRDCHWKIHLVTLPNDDRVEERYRQMKLLQAKEQLKSSFRARTNIRKSFSRLSTNNLNATTDPYKLFKEKLQHKTTDAGNQEKLLGMYLKSAEEKPSSVHNTKFLKTVYGRASKVVSTTQHIIDIRRDRIQRRNTTYKSKSQGSSHRQDGLKGLERQYWDVANKLLLSTEVWSSLDSSMLQYYDLDFQRKDCAARIIQRCARHFLKTMFSWRREFHRRDAAEEKRRRLKKLARTTALKVQREEVLDMVWGASVLHAPSEDVHEDSRPASPASMHSVPELAREPSSPVLKTQPSQSRLTRQPSHGQLSRQPSQQILTRAMSARASGILAQRPSWKGVHSSGASGPSTSTKSGYIARSNSAMVMDHVSHQPEEGGHGAAAEESFLFLKRSPSIRGDIALQRLSVSSPIMELSSSFVGNTSNSSVQESIPEFRSTTTSQQLTNRTLSEIPETSLMTQQISTAKSTFSERLPIAFLVMSEDGQRCSTTHLVHRHKAKKAISEIVSRSEDSKVLGKGKSTGLTINTDLKSKVVKVKNDASETALRSRLEKTPDRDYGLPPDVFEDKHRKLNISASLKFLQTSVKKQGVYDDVHVKRRSKSSHAIFDTANTSRPTTAPQSTLVDIHHQHLQVPKPNLFSNKR